MVSFLLDRFLLHHLPVLYCPPAGVAVGPTRGLLAAHMVRNPVVKPGGLRCNLRADAGGNEPAVPIAICRHGANAARVGLTCLIGIVAGANARESPTVAGRLPGCQVAGEVVGEPAVAVEEDRQSLRLVWLRHDGADAVPVGLPSLRRAVGQRYVGGRAPQTQAVAGQAPSGRWRRSPSPRWAPRGPRTAAGGSRAGSGLSPSRRDGRGPIRWQTAQAILRVVKEPYRLLRSVQAQ